AAPRLIERSTWSIRAIKRLASRAGNPGFPPRRRQKIRKSIKNGVAGRSPARFVVLDPAEEAAQPDVAAAVRRDAAGVAAEELPRARELPVLAAAVRDPHVLRLEH